MGDTACSFNPIYGQGMSVATVEAQTLDRCLREQEMSAGNNGVASFTRRFQQAIAKDIRTPWLLSTGEELRYPGAEGKRSLHTRLLNRYMRRVIELTASDPGLAATVLRVRNLLNPLRALFLPRIILATLRQELTAVKRQPAVTEVASEVSAPVYRSNEPHRAKCKLGDENREEGEQTTSATRSQLTHCDLFVHDIMPFKGAGCFLFSRANT